MSKKTTFDPYETFKSFHNQWEKQMNDLIHLWSNSNEFVKFTKMGSDTQAQYHEMLRKSQEHFSNQLNLPTKTDLANVVKLSIQTEEKLDTLEEQIWKIQDSVDSSNKEIETMIDVSKDIIKLAKQLKTEMTKTKKELAETKELRTELQEVKSELAEIQNLKVEIELLKDVIGGQKGEEVTRELVTANSK